MQCSALAAHIYKISLPFQKKTFIRAVFHPPRPAVAASLALGGLQSCPENQKFKCTLFCATWSLQGAKLQDDPLGQLSRCWLTLLHPRNPKSKCLNSVLLQLQHSRFSLEGLRQLPVQAQLHSPEVLQRKFGQCSPSHQKCPAPTASDPKLLCKKTSPRAESATNL